MPLACYPRSNFYPLSGSPSTRKIRITFAYFRICSTCQSHSQACLCEYTFITVSIRNKQTFARLRYFLGGTRPRQTVQLKLFPTEGLELLHTVSGISIVGSAPTEVETSKPPTYSEQYMLQS